MSIIRIPDWFERAFIAPFASKERALNCLAIFIGAFGFAGTMSYFSYDFAKYGAYIVTVFFVMRFIFANLIFIPAVFYGFYKTAPKLVYLTLILVQISVLMAVAFYPSLIAGDDVATALSSALVFSLMSIPFWACFHINMLCFTSDENRGNEVSVSALVSFMGSTFGVLFSGFALAYFPGVVTMIALFAGLVCSTVIMAIMGWKNDLAFLKEKEFNFVNAAKGKKMRLAATMQEGVFQFLIGFFAPVWMWVLGIQSVMMGVLLSMQGVIKLCVSPIAGHLFHKNKSQDILWGASIKPLGWLPWIFFQNPLVMLFSSVIWTVGIHLYAVGLGSRWYAQRCLASQALREMALGVGRIICTLIAVPVLYGIGAQAFFIFAFVMTSFTGVLALYFRRHEQQNQNKASAS